MFLWPQVKMKHDMYRLLYVAMEEQKLKDNTHTEEQCFAPGLKSRCT